MSEKITAQLCGISWILVSLLVLLAPLSPAFGESAAGARPLPTTKAGIFLGELLKLCGAKDSQKFARWLTRNSSKAALSQLAWVGWLTRENSADVCRINGRLRLESISKTDPDAISAVIKGTKLGVWYDMTVATDRSGELAGVRMIPATPSENAVSKDLSDASVRRQVTDLVSRLHRAGLFSGIVVVSRGDRILVSATAGYANRDRKSPITGTSQFELGSMAKMFTAIAAGQLVDQQRLSFDDTVCKFFPDYPNKTVRDKVTVGMLLSHTAGLGDFLMKRTPEMLKNGVQRATDFMPLYDHDEPLFPPGTSSSYSNAGFALAGAIVEKVSGETYPNYLVKHVFAAAGMTSSEPNNVPSQSDRLAIPYTKMTMQGRTTSNWHEAVRDIGSPAGGAISTADDLVRFAEALRAGKLVSKATLEKMTEDHSGVQGVMYGYGFGIKDVYDCTVVGHSGGFAGVSTRLYTFLRSPYTVVVLANQDPPAEAYAGTTILALVAEKAKIEQRNPGR